MAYVESDEGFSRWERVDNLGVYQGPASKRPATAGNAGVAELADALDSKSSARKGVEVQVLSPVLFFIFGREAPILGASRFLIFGRCE